MCNKPRLTLMASPRFELAPKLLLTLALVALACDFPVSTEHFGIRSDTGDDAGHSGDDAGHSGDDAGPTLYALLGGNSECEDDLRKACSAEIETCGHSDACATLTACALRLMYPGALAECASKLQVESASDVLRDFEMMRDCWVARAHKCEVGTNFECVGEYTAPPVALKQSLRVAQRFQYLDPGPDLQDEVFTLRACNLGDGCELPLSTGQSSANDWVELDVPLALGTASQNWAGNRLVTGTYVRPSRIERNLPLWFDHVELTLLMQEALIQAVKAEATRVVEQAAVALGLDPSYATIEDQAVFVQVLDCLGNPAADVTVTSSTITPTVYLDGDNHQLAFERTTTFRDGAASVFDIPPDTDVTLQASRDGQIVSTWTGRLAAHDVVYLKMFPTRRP